MSIPESVRSAAITIAMPGRALARVLRMIDVDGRTTLEPRDAVICVVQFSDRSDAHAVEFVQVTPDGAAYIARTVH